MTLKATELQGILLCVCYIPVCTIVEDDVRYFPPLLSIAVVIIITIEVFFSLNLDLLASKLQALPVSNLSQCWVTLVSG